MTIDPVLLRQIIDDQRCADGVPDNYVARAQEGRLVELAQNTKEILVLAGLRRSGKSVLLHRLRQMRPESDYYFNFEDERLLEFSVGDFQLLEMAFIERFGEQKSFYFDEIQNIPGWEMFVRRLYNFSNRIFITGSNANLFSEELGTRLTGRYLLLEVFPLSYREYVCHELPDIKEYPNISTTTIGKAKHCFRHYVEYGGIPEYIQHHKQEYLQGLYESILYRDIIIRYKIQHDLVLKKLIFYLASNCSKEVTYNSLRKSLELGSATTVSQYCSYLENSYLCFMLSRYSDSVKVQLQSPKKVYFIDHALARMLGFRLSEDAGRVLENIIFIELNRRGFEIYYHREKKECDFIIRRGCNTLAAIQVCQHFATEATKQREVEGLLEALQRFSLSEGYILTEDTEAVEEYVVADKRYTVRIQPIWKWLLEDE